MSNGNICPACKGKGYNDDYETCELCSGSGIIEYNNKEKEKYATTNETR